MLAQFSVELEFKVMYQGVCKLLWLKMILEDLRYSGINL